VLQIRPWCFLAFGDQKNQAFDVTNALMGGWKVRNLHIGVQIHIALSTLSTRMIRPDKRWPYTPTCCLYQSKVMLLFHSVALSPSMVVFPPAVFSTRSRRDNAMANNAGTNPKKRPLWSRHLLATFRTADDTNEKEPVCHHNDRSRLEHIPDNLLGAITAFGGPHSIAQLAATNRNLHRRCSQDGIWQNLCREYGKVCRLSVGRDVWCHGFSFVSVIGHRWFQVTMNSRL
jgi:hypothetical protein